MSQQITQDRLKLLLRYCPLDGTFTWVACNENRMGKGRGGRRRANAVAGGIDKDGYVSIKVDQHRYRAHRLVWLYMFGRWPARQIDHINRVRNDNRLANLREATPQENTNNRAPSSEWVNGGKRAKRTGPPQFRRRTIIPGKTGVNYCAQAIGKPYHSRIMLAGKKRDLGYFATRDEAHAAYLNALSEYLSAAPPTKEAAV